MNDSCPNCGKPVLDTDTICFHCGHPLPRRSKPDRPPATPPRRNRSPADQVGEAEIDLRALTVYSLLTVAVIFGLWLVMRSLSRQPILVRSAGIDFDGNWVAVTDVDLRYTMSVPAAWQWLDVAFRDQDELLEQVIDKHPYMGQALHPLGDAAGDVEILGLAVGTQALEDSTPQLFVVIGQSGRLGEVTPQTALDMLADQSLPVTEAEIDTHLAGQPQARFTVNDAPEAYQCRHLFVAGDSAENSYLVAACAPQTQFATLRRDFDDILDSFQLLER
jgi:hypothetical protein